MATVSTILLHTSRRFAVAVATLLFPIASASACRAQAPQVLCTNEGGGFDSTFRTGVSVHVGSARNGELASRVCEADLTWGNEKLVVAPDAAEIDVDVFGADLGLGAPVVAFQIKQSEAECCMTYQIYSLVTPPRLLHTIRGGERFYAADTDLDGRVEIWTNDAAAVEGFDDLSPKVFDLAPTLVLRFENGKLLNVGSDFVPYFDQEIASTRAKNAPADFLAFERSDGRLAPLGADAPVDAIQERDRLQSAKAAVLEIVWSYLYSGREDDAWKALSDMWPPDDLDRIRTTIQGAFARGVLAQLDGAASPVPGRGKRQASIFDARFLTDLARARLGFTVPQEIIGDLTYSTLGHLASDPQQTDVVLDLLIDSAGKVRSAVTAKNSAPVNPALLASTADWKFVPAFLRGRPVPCRLFYTLSLER
jgi:hypothetical protein